MTEQLHFPPQNNETPQSELVTELATSTPGVHPETGYYHVDFMPPATDEILRAVREKQLSGDSLTIAELMRAGRDSTVDSIDGYELKPDHAYRAVGQAGLESYLASGIIEAPGDEPDEYEHGNNKGVDWYLGAVALRYGDVVLETPADPEYFQPAVQNGHALAKDPKVRHMKSSGRTNPVPMEKVRIISVPAETKN